MDEALVWVVVGAVAVGVLGAIAAAFARGSAYDHIGGGPLRLDGGTGGPAADADAAPRDAALRDAEIRQLLEARNARRRRRGQLPLDPDAELARLARPAADPALAAELRELVVARNRRRERRGQPPLDVEAEVRRGLGDLPT